MDGPRPFMNNELDPNSLFLQTMFRRYYRAFTPTLPDRFTRKEFGFIQFGKTMQRHMAFRNAEDLKYFMGTRVPAHSYYSTSYYRYPSQMVMEDKKWMGAELIFDLDADHLAGADRMTYSEMMVQIRKEMISLVDDFLLSDLGFDEKQVGISFSGGRGYHAHIRSNDIYTLGTNERRELVDYVSCIGMDMDWVFPIQAKAISSTSMGGANIHKFHLIPSKEEGGWKRKMRAALEDAVQDLVELDPKDFKKKYPFVQNQSSLVKISERIAKCRNRMFSANTMVDLTNSDQEFLINLMSYVAPTFSSEVDKPVTPDIKRLIRLPGSLHGKTGLRVTPITRNQLTDYDPLQTAVPETYTDKPVKVTVKRKMDLDMLGQHYRLEGETEVPEYAAAFLIGRKYADFGWASENKERLF
ncbi:MAG: DNA primase catalytic subunit PriS [archaeon]|nr:DNA primase catalytic subunit PriS [archaeon]